MTICNMLVAKHLDFPSKSIAIYFIPSSETSAYLKQIKGILSAVKTIVFFH